MGIFKNGLTAAVLCLAAGAASATTVFDFRNPTLGNRGMNSWDGNFGMTVDGLTVKATAGIYSTLGGTETIVTTDCKSIALCFSEVTETKVGLGVGGAFGLRRTAGIGGLPFSFGELITLTFDKEVAFDEVLFKRLGGPVGPTFDLFVDGKVVAKDQLIQRKSPYSLTGLTGTSISFGADKFRLPYFGTQRDSFMIAGMKVSEIEKATNVAAVPLPASAPLLAAGLLGFAALRRRRKAA